MWPSLAPNLMTRGLRHNVLSVSVLLGLMIGPAVDPARAAMGASLQRDRDARDLQPAPLPDVSRLHSSVQQQLSEAHRSLTTAARDRDVSPRDLSDAHGEMGTLFMAAEFLLDAERCFRTAELLAPDVFRWPYYLGHLLRRTGELTRAVESFERALQIRPADEAAGVWLSRAYLDVDRPEAAKPLVTEMLSRHPEAPAVRFEAGRVALATEDYDEAVEHLEAALTLNPEATSIHYPLAMAYRHLGDLDQARSHLRQRGGRGAAASVPVGLPDPLMTALIAVLRNPQYARDLAVHFFTNEDWPLAVLQFRKAVDVAPDSAPLRLSLGRALEQLGEAREAQAQFEEALALDPGLSRAHYYLGALLARSGRDQEAIDRFTAAVTHNPNFAAAHLALADALRRGGRLEESIAHYRRVIELEPANREARFGEAMALVRLARYAEARERLTGAMTVHPGQSEFSHGLARLLAAAPDDQVRDGARAWDLVQALAATQQNTAVAETMAMALAELGRFESAVEWQRVAMAVATRAERPDISREMAANLALYLAHQPCRMPWRDDDPDHRPGPPVDPGLLDPPSEQ
jgi:tetratricopeptide (TPR) repeat protein